MPDGLIAYYGLTDWWQAALSLEEQERLDAVFTPMGGQPRSLTQGTVGSIHGDTATAANLLAALIGWLTASQSDLALRRKLRAKVAALVDVLPTGVARHFALQVLIREFYRDRATDPDALSAAIARCREQIAMAGAVAPLLRDKRNGLLPRHVGYEQLAIVLEKERKFGEAIGVAEAAEAQGWAGSWHARILRCQRKDTDAGVGARSG